MVLQNRPVRFVLGFSAVLTGLIPQTAWARGDRVMGSADEGATLRAAYILKMEKIDLDKKSCRKDIEEIIAPELARLDQLGLAGHAGPARSVKEEAQLKVEAQKMAQLQQELVRLGKLLNQQPAGPRANQNLAQFEKSLREYSKLQKNFNTLSNSIVGQSEQAVKNFVPFAQAVLKIKNTEACELIWADLRKSIPRNMEQMVVRNNSRIKQQVAEMRAPHALFATQAQQLVLRSRTKSQVAVEE